MRAGQMKQMRLPIVAPVRPSTVSTADQSGGAVSFLRAGPGAAAPRHLQAPWDSRGEQGHPGGPSERCDGGRRGARSRLVRPHPAPGLCPHPSLRPSSRHLLRGPKGKSPGSLETFSGQRGWRQRGSGRPRRRLRPGKGWAAAGRGRERAAGGQAGAAHVPSGIRTPPTAVPNTTERVRALNRRGGM